MCIEEIQIDKGLEKFLNVAMKYYSCRYGTARDDWRAKAEAQWNGLPLYKDKMKVLEFMQSKIKQLEGPSIKITKFFKQIPHSDLQKQEIKIAQIEQQSDIEEQAGMSTVQKSKKSRYSRFFEENYWKMKLENEILSHEEIQLLIKKLWEENEEDRTHNMSKQKLSF
ncbi:unnamed protein product (macronuclear) [Paramecium tetraurelia]|uniref:HMG box domain-containing protein n=1 Tax=Paramecium tetraurelia TaxID=5888 RepID=A0DV82_PARTE|nr:uncharacterized protein GSPATT00020613001 [Paramecium tetraurelia]CAK86949.1 unnamed protein product [Paramecium tetraurelia]|eukprot:XP_001454346.1 hypothetical protein (macronuclear) [Paramecium tetraurelia strain d4-2]